MSDSSTLFPVNKALSCNAIKMEQPISLYVPVIPPTLYFCSSAMKQTVEDDSSQGKSIRFQPKFLKYYIENCMRIGKVRRIDFATREVPQYTTPQVCAFIHFDCFYDNDTTTTMFSDLDKGGKYRSYGYEYGDDYVKFGGYHSNPHLLFKINHKPIDTPKEYERNIEQVMSENKLLIEKLQEREETLRQVLSFIDVWDKNDNNDVVIALSGLKKIMNTNSVEHMEEIAL